MYLFDELMKAAEKARWLPTLSTRELPVVGDGYGEVTNPAQTTIEMVLALQDAGTLRQVYSIPFPLITNPLPSLENFASYYDVAKRRRLISLFDSNGVQFTRARREELEPLEGFLDTSFRLNDAVSKCMGPHTKWNTGVRAYKSSAVRHGDRVHFDFPEAYPRDIIAYASNSDATFVLPHHITPFLLTKLGLGSALDLPLDSPNIHQILKQLYNEMQSVYCRGFLHNHMVRTTINHVNIMTGATIHTRSNVVSPRRVFSNARTHFEP